MNGDSILLVEDDKEIRPGVEIFLRSQGYQVFQAENGLEGLKLLEERPIDLAIVDVMMPVMDGITMTAKLREKYDFPVIFLSAKTEEVDKILGLNIGADDYVTKPFSNRELIARVKANLRRQQLAPAEAEEEKTANEIVLGSLIIHEDAYVVSKRGEEIELTHREFELLHYLAKHIGQVITREHLLQTVWGYDYFGDVRTVDVTVRRLREKIEDTPSHPTWIMTRRGVGYYIKTPDQEKEA